jgi:hypothetical protein
MPTNLGQFAPTQPQISATIFAPADTTVAKSIIPNVGQPWRLVAISIASTDTVSRVVDIYIRITAANFLFASIVVPPGSGVGGVAPVEVVEHLPTLLATGIDFAGIDAIQAAMETTITAATAITITSVYALY